MSLKMGINFSEFEIIAKLCLYESHKKNVYKCTFESRSIIYNAKQVSPFSFVPDSKPFHSIATT